MSGTSITERPDYSLLLKNLQIALYEKTNNPYTQIKNDGSVFIWTGKKTSEDLKQLLNKMRLNGGPPFIASSEYKEVLDLYSDDKEASFSGNQSLFFISHLGGWTSEKVTLSDKITAIFTDNGRIDGGVRKEFYDDIRKWRYMKDTEENYRFFIKNSSIGKTLSPGSHDFSEYIVECNCFLISQYCEKKDALKKIIADFARNMSDAERSRKEKSESYNADSDSKKMGNLYSNNQAELELLCDCLDRLVQAYESCNDIWLLARALAWLVIGAMLRDKITCKLLNDYLLPCLPKLDEIGEAYENDTKSIVDSGKKENGGKKERGNGNKKDIISKAGNCLEKIDNEASTKNTANEITNDIGNICQEKPKTEITAPELFWNNLPPKDTADSASLKSNIYNSDYVRLQIAWKNGDLSSSSDINILFELRHDTDNEVIYKHIFNPAEDLNGKDADGYYYVDSDWIDIVKGDKYCIYYEAYTIDETGKRQNQTGNVYAWIQYGAD